MTAPALPLNATSAALRPHERRWLTAGVAGVHLAALWGLLQAQAVQELVRERAPLVVDFITLAPPPPPKAQPTPPPRPTPPPKTAAPPPPRPAPAPVVTAAPSPAPAPAFTVPEPAPAPVAVAAPSVAPAPPTPPAPPAPPPAPAAPKAVAASALRYAVPPPIEVPMASRRLGESGTVVLRVVFDTQGRAKQVSVQRSSGHARLDEQALGAMRQARITPYLENGQAIEVVATAPVAYELE